MTLPSRNDPAKQVKISTHMGRVLDLLRRVVSASPCHGTNGIFFFLYLPNVFQNFLYLPNVCQTYIIFFQSSFDGQNIPFHSLNSF